MDIWRIENSIDKKYKHLLWQDEAYQLFRREDDRHTFLLTSFCEIYRYTKDTFKLIIFTPYKMPLLRKSGLIFNEWGTDDNLYLCEIKVADLDKILALEKRKKRIYLEGKRLKHLEERLGHKIIKYDWREL